MNEFPAGNDANPGDDIEATRNFSEDLIESDQETLSEEERAAVDALPSGNALLIVRRGPNQGARFLLDSDVTSVGRHPNADIFLDDVTVSRRHAEFKRTGKSFSVSDLASLNGTQYEGERVESAELVNGSEVQIGKYHLTFFASKKDI
ncbi:MAG: FHA domain-containing protein [Microbacteriaceae bacterium]|nr:FHA domain-containing protein [Microbacteriaceae bacterium]NBS61893.1 FHA domain-containing protein [Microbacteriaceae bacterium]NBS86384.1 FHA domain-containing protein [Micrococcales bacterium]